MENKIQPLTPKQFLKTIKIIHSALVLGIMLFVSAILFITISWELKWDTEDLLFFIVPVFAFLGIFAGTRIYKSQLKTLKSKSSLREKLLGFQTASIIQYALLEAPILLAIMVSFLTGNFYYLLIAGVLIIYFISLRPTKKKIENDLEFNYDYKHQYSKSDQEIN